jgi:hypothetical protein
LIIIHFSLVANAVTLTTYVISGILPAMINGVEPAKLNVYPNYLLVYLHQLIVGQCCILTVVLIFYSKRPKLRNFHKRQCEEVIDSVKNWFGF